MKKEHWQHIESIIDRILSAESETERLHIIEKECEDDRLLRKEILSFLDSIKESSGLWNKLHHSNEVLMNDFTKEYPVREKIAGYIKKNKIPAKKTAIPQQIGNYQVKKRIGYGGMGEVYLASRTDAKFHQNVALKLIRCGISSHEESLRFEQERAILSSLNHPNIARLLDGGISDDGRSYYVMEYIDGVPITTYCKQNKCSLEQRLALFKQVCKAVQYAHSNFIVHRDLKPDNLLVNKKGQVKVLDFGISKLLDNGVNDQTLLQTGKGMRMMSLKFAAPEQLTLEPITTATDVYALGLLLFKLLTEKNAFTLNNKSFQETEYIIRNHEAPKPSSVANKWADELRGDLDAIILKALRKDSSDRYDSARHLLDDIEHYQKSLPVSARLDTIPYRAKKFTKRHTIPLIFSVVIFTLISAFTLFYTTRIAQEKHEAQLQAQKAEQVTTFLMDLFKASNPFETDGETITVRQLLERGEQRAESLKDQPEIQAQMFDVTGRIYRQLGEFDKSRNLLDKALELRKDHFGIQHPETVDSFDNLGLLLIETGDFVTADSLLRLALDIREKHLDPNHISMANTINTLGFVTRRMGNQAQAESLYRRSLKIRTDNLGSDHPLTIENLGSLGIALHNQGKYAETEEIFRKVLEHRKQFLGGSHPDVATSLNNLGALLMNVGRFEEAEPLFWEALNIRKNVFGKEHPSVALTMNNLAISLRDQAKYSEASDLFEEALAIRLHLMGDQHFSVGVSKFSIAKLMLESDKPDSALALYNEAYRVFNENLTENHSFTARALIGIGSSYLAMNNLSLAEQYFVKGYDKIKQIHSDTSLERALADIQYGTFLIKMGDIHQANQVLNSAYFALQTIENFETNRQKDVLSLLNTTQ